jgi:LysR family transcriptional regulator, cyn operon transcriptional activator
MIYDKLDLNALKIFISVYENGGIVSASKKLYLSQPAVTIAIKKLENSLDGKLFFRFPKGVKPTQEGVKFYNYCKNALSLIDSGVQNFSEYSSLSKGKISIGASQSIIENILMPKINIFCKMYPNIKIEFTEVIDKRLENYLKRGDLDLAFIENFEKVDNYKYFDICELSPVFVSKDISSIDFKNLDKYKFCILKQNTIMRSYFDKFCETNNLIIEPSYEMSNYKTLIDFCLSDIPNVIGLIPKEFIKGDVLKSIDINYPLNKINLSAIITNTELSIASKKFLELFNIK